MEEKTSNPETVQQKDEFFGRVWHCNRCGYNWMSRRNPQKKYKDPKLAEARKKDETDTRDKPTFCPQCHSRFWYEVVRHKSRGDIPQDEKRKREAQRIADALLQDARRRERDAAQFAIPKVPTPDEVKAMAVEAATIEGVVTNGMEPNLDDLFEEDEAPSIIATAIAKSTKDEDTHTPDSDGEEWYYGE